MQERLHGPPSMARRPFWAKGRSRKRSRTTSYGTKAILGLSWASLINGVVGRGHGQTAGKSNLRHVGAIIVVGALVNQ